MAQATGKGEKFAKAREFMFQHPELSSRLINWRKMKWPALYKAMELCGAKWDIDRKVWGLKAESENGIEVKVKQVPTRTASDQNSVLVRIMSDRHVIAQATNELLELARASNLTVLSVSEPINNRNGEYQRIYVKLHFHRDARK